MKIICRERELKVFKVYMVVGGVFVKYGREEEIEVFLLEMRSFGVDLDIYFFNLIIRGYGNKGFVYLVF